MRESSTKQLQVGEKVHLDDNPYYFVEVVSQTPMRVYTRVRNVDSGAEWDVMTYRISTMEEMRNKTAIDLIKYQEK